MNHEEFEHKLRSHDPAANLEGRDSAEHRELLERAISGQPTNVISISRWSNRRKAISAAAAALLVIGVGGPIVAGSTSASPNRLVFGESQTNGMASDKSMAGMDLKESSMNGYYIGYWGFYHYELSGEASVNLPANAPAYKIVNVANVDERVKEIAAALGVTNLTTSNTEVGSVTNSDAETSLENFYSWTQSGQASFSYYNGNVDPWRNCYKDVPVVDSEPEACEPISRNLFTKTEAKNAAKQLLDELGFETSNLRYEIYANDYSTDVYVVEQINGNDSPISYYISYASEGKLYSVGGSLTKLVEVGTYDLVGVQAAVNRANDLSDRTIDLWNTQIDTDTKNGGSGGSGSGTAEDGEVSEPSDSSVDPAKPTDQPTEPTEIVEPGPQTSYSPTTVTVTKVELSYQMYWMEDGITLWLPVFNFFGTTADLDEVNQYGSIVAVSDSQIDLDSLYKAMGMLSPMSRTAILD